MRVIVTRPAAQAAAWVQALSQHGVDAVALPLITIAPPADPAAVAAAWRGLPAHRLAVFVSPSGAVQFFARRPEDMAWPSGVSAAAVGPGTADVLGRHGVPAAALIQPRADSPSFDSEALWRQLRTHDWQGAPVLIVRGDGGRDWLADTLRTHGAAVRFVAAYRRRPPHFDAAGLQLLDEAAERPDAHLWFFSSAEAVDHLAAARPAAGWSLSRAVATHPRIAEHARACGFGVVHESRPSVDSVVGCIQSIAS
jgi:uroporphyrinogen-III synthase